LYQYEYCGHYVFCSKRGGENQRLMKTGGLKMKLNRFGI